MIAKAKTLVDGYDDGAAVGFNEWIKRAWDLLLLQKSPLSLSQNELSTRTLLAKAITRIASGGERDVDRLAKFAVTAVKYQAG